jgi:hypothetical protein
MNIHVTKACGVGRCIAVTNKKDATTDWKQEIAIKIETKSPMQRIVLKRCKNSETQRQLLNEFHDSIIDAFNLAEERYEKEKEELVRKIIWSSDFHCPKCGILSYKDVTTKKTCILCNSGLIRAKHPILVEKEEEISKLKKQFEGTYKLNYEFEKEITNLKKDIADREYHLIEQQVEIDNLKADFRRRLVKFREAIEKSKSHGEVTARILELLKEAK